MPARASVALDAALAPSLNGNDVPSSFDFRSPFQYSSEFRDFSPVSYPNTRPCSHTRALRTCLVYSLSWLTNVAPGLRSDSSVLPPPTYAGHYLFANFLFTYGILQPRFLKISLGLDNNVMPRQDVPEKGEEAVRSGKVTREQLNMVKRNEGAHANAIENFAGFGAAMLWAQVAGVSNAEINAAGLIYTVARLTYAANYLTVESEQWSWVRTICWWTGNITILRLFYSGASLVNKRLA